MLPWQMKRIATGVSRIFIIVLVLLVLPRNALFCKGARVIVICSEITDCGKSEQDLASCYYLLVVKLVVEWERVTTKGF